MLLPSHFLKVRLFITLIMDTHREWQQDLKLMTYWTYCDNHFMTYVNQIIMLYTLNLYVLYVNHISIKLEEKKTYNYGKPKKKS